MVSHGQERNGAQGILLDETYATEIHERCSVCLAIR